MTSSKRPERMPRTDGRTPGRLSLTPIRVLMLLGVLLGLVATAFVSTPAASAATANLWGTEVPKAEVDEDTKAVELGVQFSSSVAGSVLGVRFYKNDADLGTHVGSLWSADGKRLASVTFTNETSSGWQEARFSQPVTIEPKKPYVASYVAPRGRYLAAPDFFDRPFSSGDLAVEAGGSVYNYDVGNFPTSRWRNSNYFVDVVFTSNPTASPAPSTTRPPNTPNNPDEDTDPPSDAAELALPRIPWEGGPAFWKQFAKTDAAGWDDPSFFPVIAWFNGVSTNAEVTYDKSLGINTYIGMWEGTPYHLFEDNGVFWAGGKLNDSFKDSSKNWVGVFLDDEVDGRFTPAEGRSHLTKVAQEYSGQGRFTYANYTQMVMSKDMKPADAEWYVNEASDVVSLDMYWYTIPYCNWRPYRDVYLVPIEQKYCRTASSYGKAVSSLRQRDAADGKLKPLWQWIENLNGGPAGGPFTANITPEQMQGAVMSSLIHEARGIAYFNQSFTGPCEGSATFRLSQNNPTYCGNGQVAAAKDINTKIKKLAPVLNTQSYKHTFGSGLDTMLKAKDGYAYVFAMVDGSSDPGSRSFTLPAEVTGRSVEVLFENRTLAASASGVFGDTFSRENSYHIYKIKI